MAQVEGASFGQKGGCYGIARSFTSAVSAGCYAFFRSPSAEKKGRKGRKAHPAIWPALSAPRLSLGLLKRKPIIRTGRWQWNYADWLR